MYFSGLSDSDAFTRSFSILESSHPAFSRRVLSLSLSEGGFEIDPLERFFGSDKKKSRRLEETASIHDSSTSSSLKKTR